MSKSKLSPAVIKPTEVSSKPSVKPAPAKTDVKAKTDMPKPPVTEKDSTKNDIIAIRSKLIDAIATYKMKLKISGGRSQATKDAKKVVTSLLKELTGAAIEIREIK